MSYKRNNHFAPSIVEFHDIIISLKKKYVNIVELHERKNFITHIIILEFHEGLPRKGLAMKLNDAIVTRIEEICKEKNVNICDACLKGGMSPSAIYDLFKGRTKCSKVITVKRFCEGVEITLAEFFDREYFNTAEE